MNPFIVLLVTVVSTTLLTTVFFVLKYGGYAFTTIPNWPILVVVALINVGVIYWFVTDFLSADELPVSEQVDGDTSVEIPVKSTGYAPKLFRYHPFRIFSSKPIAQAQIAPVLSYRSALGTILFTETGMFVSVITKNFVERTAIRQITIVSKDMGGTHIGEMMTIELHNGAYYRIWLRLAEPEKNVSELGEALRDLGYPVNLTMDYTL